MSEKLSKHEFTVVGIGASAGGLNALKIFLDHVPADSGLAFVVVVHLSPEHKSHLAALLQPHVSIPVQQVTETTKLEPNRVFVIPPNANLNTIDTHLRLSDLEEDRRERAPIDHFFRTLANTHDGHAVAVILTGTGSDGSRGIQEVKDQGGMIVVQDPNEAEFDDMPQSAIATGFVDRVLPVADIPEAILRYHNTEPKVVVRNDDAEPDQNDRALLHRVFALLRSRTGRDFSRYKPSTILRRIARRMQLNYLEDLRAYYDQLRQQPDEVRVLADDLLVTVSSFFCDPEVFEKLASDVIPHLFDRKGHNDPIRVWSVGCATGEEAYSLAMLLVEEAERRDNPPHIQMFASDLHTPSLDKAREGFYFSDIEAEVSRDRLSRFFVPENGGFRIRQEIRELIVFAPHNLVGDPPFSHLDLVACRNLLIYLQRQVQRDVVELFYYALNPNGYLLLGNSESVDDIDLFHTEDKRLCLFRKRNVTVQEPRLPVFPLTRLTFPASTSEPASQPISYGVLHHQLVERHAPPSILVGPDDKIVHISENAGRYLIHPGGELTSRVLNLVRIELRLDLRSLLQIARTSKEPVDSNPIPVKFNGHPVPVVMHVRPALDPHQAGFVLVIFEERKASTGEKSERSSEDQPDSGRVQELQAELNASRHRLQVVIEEYEAGREEMHASNEELQSSNEELRSTMEELETSKEELQSINEELQTVNQENRHRMAELAQLSGYLQNLLTATDIATLFLDREMRILRFTPKLGELFNIRVTDHSRPISDLTHRLGYQELRTDAEAVLSRLIPVERELQDERGRWYLTRLLPYRGSDDRIEGVVVTLIDITARKQTEEALRESKLFSESVIATLHEPILVLTPDLRVHSANPAFFRYFSVRPDDTLGRLIYDLGNGQWNIPGLRKLLEDVLPANSSFSDFEVEHEFDTIGRRVMLLNARRINNEQILLGVRDITEKKRSDDILRQSEERYRLLIESAHEYAILMLDPQGRVATWNSGAQRIFGFTDAEIVGRDSSILFTEEDRAAGVPEQERKTAVATGQAADDRWQARKDGSRFWASGVIEALREADGTLLGFVKVLRDNTERKEAEENLRTSNIALLRANADLRQFAMAASHDLREPLRMVTNYTQFMVQAARLGREQDMEMAVRFILDGTERMGQLLTDLLTYTQLNIDEEDFTERVDMNAALGKALDNLRSAIERQGAEVASGPLPPVIGRETYFTQLFQNLVENAIKYRSEEPPKIRISVKREGRNWVFAVADNGIGIEPAYHQQIFGVFKRLDKRVPGTGIGLAICQRVVERAGGRIWVESGLHEGSTFYFTLPAV